MKPRKLFTFAMPILFLMASALFAVEEKKPAFNAEEALKTLTAAYRAKRDPEIAAHLGEIYWTSGNRDEALKVWRSALSENPEHEALNAVLRKYQP